MFINFFFRTFVATVLLFLSLSSETLAGVTPRPDSIPDSIVSLSSGYVIVVDKQYQKIYVFHKNGTFTRIFEAPCSTGKNLGGKQVAGDAKTPNGIFFATKILRNPGTPEVYGSFAFPLDYPSLPDIRAGRNGNNIWIHGTTKPLLPFQSNGCVVLRDNDLQRLIDIIYFNKTPVVIAESLNWVVQNQISPAKEELERILFSWNKAFLDGDMKYLDSLYLPGNEIKGKKREEVASKIKALKNLNKHFALNPYDISILKQDNNAVIMFGQIAAINSDNSFQGSYTKLVLEKNNNKWYIIDDAIAPANNGKNYTPVSNKLQDEPKTVSTEAINDLVTKWASSWKTGDMKTYRSCYVPAFKSKKMNLNDWVEHKNDIRQRSKNINVRVENLRITAKATSATASFTQHYSSSILKSKSAKKLELKKINNEWKILRETI
jgi:murein L,D-transpeptidase YafK